MINSLSVDLEPWYVGELLRKHIPGENDSQIEEAVSPILDLLDKYKTKATFFVLGTVAEKNPKLVREIYDKGHEIGSHAYSHKTLHELGEEAFREEIEKSVKLLESITGEKPIGFRAPSFSINNSTKWAFKVLKAFGFKYDSSIFPVRTKLYGVPNAPVHFYRPSMADVSQHDPEGDIVEFPLAVLKLGMNIPVAGGFYLRMLPLWFIKFAIRKINQTNSAVIYVHPWETYPGTSKVGKMPVSSRSVSRYGIRGALRKLEGLLAEFEFRPLRELLDEV